MNPISWNDLITDSWNYKKNKFGGRKKRKTIAICECGKGTRVKGELRRCVVKENDGYCVHCKHAVFWRAVKLDWKPSDGLSFNNRKIRNGSAC